MADERKKGRHCSATSCSEHKTGRPIDWWNSFQPLLGDAADEDDDDGGGDDGSGDDGGGDDDEGGGGGAASAISSAAGTVCPRVATI